MTLSSGSHLGPYGQQFIVNSRRTEDVTQPITVVVGWAPEAKK